MKSLYAIYTLMVTSNFYGYYFAEMTKYAANAMLRKKIVL
jgi:UDP-glucose 6-dehydrogenase